MKIAIIGSFRSKIPLEQGKIHAPLVLTYKLAEGLAEKGHEVTFFGSFDKKIKKGSKINFDNLGYRELDEQLLEQESKDVSEKLKLIYEQAYLSKILKEKDFDLFYTWAGFRIAPLVRLCDKPVVVTHHDSTNIKKYELMFDASKTKNLYMIHLSKYMQKILPYSNSLGVVHHGVDENDIVARKNEDYFSWVGRIVPSKGLHIAIELAKKMNFKLKVVGPMENFAEFRDNTEYLNKIKKLLDENKKNIEYLGQLSLEDSRKVIAKSKGFLFPNDGTESFSLVVIEAIVAGVPVVALKKGPIPELINDGKTGFLCKNEKELIRGVENIDKIDREKCREIGIKRFSTDKMVSNYEKKFELVIKRS